MAVSIALTDVVIDKVNGIKSLKRGYQQTVIVRVPGLSFRGVDYPDEYFVIAVYSTSQTDSRFLSPSDERKTITVHANLKGERWTDSRDGSYNYGHKLNLKEWERPK